MQYKYNKPKLILFFLILSFSLSVTVAMGITYASLQFPSLVIVGLITGPFVMLYVFRKKGTYKTSVLLISLLEIALLCTSLYNSYFAAIVLFNILIGIVISSSIIMCPIITYYLRGPISFLNVFPGVLIAFFSGFILANPLFLLPEKILTSGQLTFMTLLLLICSFFAVFSAWRHRLVLLK